MKQKNIAFVAIIVLLGLVIANQQGLLGFWTVTPISGCDRSSHTRAFNYCLPDFKTLSATYVCGKDTGTTKCQIYQGTTTDNLVLTSTVSKGQSISIPAGKCSAVVEWNCDGTYSTTTTTTTTTTACEHNAYRCLNPTTIQLCMPQGTYWDWTTVGVCYSPKVCTINSIGATCAEPSSTTSTTTGANCPDCESVVYGQWSNCINGIKTRSVQQYDCSRCTAVGTSTETSQCEIVSECNTCESIGATCGVWTDGCGGTINCGTCTAEEISQCIATTCAAEGKTCGSIPDGCGNTLNCGSTPDGYVCVANVLQAVNDNNNDGETDDTTTTTTTAPPSTTFDVTGLVIIAVVLVAVYLFRTRKKKR